MHGARPLRSTRRLQNLTGVLAPWWRIENKADTAGPTLVSIYDEIGLYGVSAGDFLAEMRQISGDIEMHINSPGGDVFDGIAIYNQLKQAQKRGTVHVVVDGIAASAASFIAQAASPGRLEMAPHSTMMIHDGFAMGIGNEADFLELAGQLKNASNNIADIYASRTGKPAEYWRDMMRKETWLSAQETVSIGLADRIQGDDNSPSNAWDLSIYDRWSNTAGGDRQLGDGWVTGADGKDRFDPDGDGDDDSTPEGDTDHDYFDADGKQIKPIPPKPGTNAAAKAGIRNATEAAGHGGFTGTHTHAHTAHDGPDGDGDGFHGHEHTHAGEDHHQHDHAGAAGVYGHVHGRLAAASDAAVDNSAWDASKAWHNGTQADDPSAFYEGICAGKKTGDPDTQAAWALPYRYHPDDPPNAAGVRAALARLSQTQGLINKAEAKELLEAAIKKINPDYKPGDHIDGGLLSAVFTSGLRGATK